MRAIVPAGLSLKNLGVAHRTKALHVNGPATKLSHLLFCTAMCASTALAQQSPERRNWFDDPFFQVSDKVPNCPVPAGPFITEAERRVQSHGRAERGTTCWLVGKCERPNSYTYDKDIAQAVQAAFKARNPAPRSSLWVTVQRRIVYVEGCVADARDPQVVPKIEAMLLAVPDVERAIANVYVKGKDTPHYKLLNAP